MNVYEIVTDRIIAELEKGNIPWQRPWDGAAEGAYNMVSKKPYSLINQLLLQHKDAYLTYKQAQALGGTVKKGAKSEIVVFWKMYPSKNPEDVVIDKDGTERTKMIPVLRYYNVFWVGDCEGIERSEAPVRENDPIEAAEQVIRGYIDREDAPGFEDNEPSNSAYYRPATDTIHVPMIDQYEFVEEYYSTCFHEMAHSTGAKNRLNRDGVAGARISFGSEVYSKEELVAEMSAAMLVNLTGIETDKSFKNSAAYIQSWLKALKNDSRMVVMAAGKAEKAVNYILGKEVE